MALMYHSRDFVPWYRRPVYDLKQKIVMFKWRYGITTWRRPWGDIFRGF